jgi:hypothetical protein
MSSYLIKTTTSNWVDFSGIIYEKRERRKIDVKRKLSKNCMLILLGFFDVEKDCSGRLGTFLHTV